MHTEETSNIDPYWRNLDNEVPSWGGINDVTELPEYVYAKVFWDVMEQFWPTVDEVFEKYGIEDDEHSAVSLNIAGFKLYERKEYLDAITLFREAVWLDPSYQYAHYNIACCGALIIEKLLEIEKEGGDPSRYGRIPISSLYIKPDNITTSTSYSSFGDLLTVPYMILDEIFNHLAISYFLNNEYRKKALVDSDLSVLRPMKRFKYFSLYAENDDYWPFYGYFTYETTSRHGTYLHKPMSTLDGRNYSLNARLPWEYRQLIASRSLFHHSESENETSTGDSYNGRETRVSWTLMKLRELGYKPFGWFWAKSEYSVVSMDKITLISPYVKTDEGRPYFLGFGLVQKQYPFPLEVNADFIRLGSSEEIDSEITLTRTNAGSVVPEKYLK